MEGVFKYICTFCCSSFDVIEFKIVENSLFLVVLCVGLYSNNSALEIEVI